MSRHPRHLPRQDLHSYGFKYGDPWGHERRALELALYEMDLHEREIQQHYAYNQAASPPPPGYPQWWPSTPPSRHQPRSFGGGRYTPRYHDRPLQIPVSRNNSGTYPASEASMEPRPFHDIRYGESEPRASHGYFRTRSKSHDYPRYSTPEPDYIPSVMHRSLSGHSSHSIRNRPNQYYAPPLRPATPDYQSFHDVPGVPHSPLSEGSYHGFPPSTPGYQDFHDMTDIPHSPMTDSSYHGFPPSRTSSMSRSSSHTGSSHSASFHEDSALPPISPAGQQLVRYRGGQQEPHTPDNYEHYATSRDTPNPLSLQWSMEGTQGTPASMRGSPSLCSSQDVYSDDGNSASTDPVSTHSSGYVESFDVRSHHREFYDSDDGEYHHGHLSNGVGSDEVAYRSPNVEQEEDPWDSHERYLNDSGDFYEDGDYNEGEDGGAFASAYSDD